MKKIILLFSILLWPTLAQAVDATSNVTEIFTSGRWQVIEFAATKQLIYRISSLSSNTPDTNITFDFVPTRKCEPTAAVMISRQTTYSPGLDNGIVPFSYKSPGQKESTELTKTAMQRGGDFAFFSFQKLTVKTLLQSRDKGSLAVWIPSSGDGIVKRSSNIYFPLEGFTSAHERARKMCNDNR